MTDDNYTPPLPKADDASYSEAVMPAPMKVLCIGRTGSDPCGYYGGKSGGTCPECGGMLLSERGIALADKSAKEWEERDSLLTVDELIQAMRTSGSLSDIRKRLEKLREKDPSSFNVFCRFYGA